MGRSVMGHTFSRVPEAEIQRSSFDRSHGLKTTFNAGYLVPIYVDEALPGDTFNLNLSAFARLATPLKPIMDNMFLETFFFAVPYRLLWSNWERFNGAQDDPGDSTDFLIPQMVAPVGGYTELTLPDYMGLPIGVPSLTHSALPFRAYSLIWNEWFRDQNLQDSIVISKGDGPDSFAAHQIKFRGKRHDYFTSCLPWPQKGPDVMLPLGGLAPVVNNTGVTSQLLTHPVQHPSDSAATSGWQSIYVNVGAGDRVLSTSMLPVTGGDYFTTQINPAEVAPHLSADLSDATAATINSIREAFQVQRLYERDARGGTRYTEILRSHFGVTSPDARLQRPEYLGGGSTPVNFHPIAKTAGTSDDGNPQGNLAAFGTASAGGHGFTKSFTEHCILIGLVNVRADLTYQQGLDRMWSRRTRFDHYWPALSHLGEQAVLNKEIFADGTSSDDEVFGYQERYAEYRHKQSRITGYFRSTSSLPLDIWHLAQEFENCPTLSDEFIRENPPMDRISAVPSEPDFLFDGYFHLKCARPMPTFGTPGMVDHF